MRKGGSSSADDTQRNIDNSAKTFLANIRFMSVDNPVRTVVVTSAIPNEGKTFVTANLARAMATSGIRTLLVECDMRRRSMSHVLHVHAQHGLYSVVSGEVDLQDAVVPTGTHRLHFLDAEPHIPNPSDLLSSRRFTALIEQAKKEFGYIVFDTPPVGTFVDAAVLGAKVDAVFMVVREQYTRKDEIVRAADQLKTANVPLSGIVMNFCERQNGEYYYYDYYYREDRPKKRAEDKLEGRSFGPLSGFGERFGRGEKDVAPAPAPVQQPRSWNNAPDIEYDSVLGDTGALNARRASSIPSIGETGVIEKVDIATRLDTQ